MKPVRILFVCLGNICRSPLAEGVMRDLAHKAGHGRAILVDSAGIGAWHVGAPPDQRSISVAKAHGIDIAALRGRQVSTADFAAFDLILGMDMSTVRDLSALAPPAMTGKVHLFMRYATGQAGDVPDPYYEAAEVFETLYQMLDAGCLSLLARLGDRAS
ncbi:low molecular weight protein-tyrosine-phosphatase [Sinorhizobium mexicanum]|uniref:protein-tyrosine-phosphatase n=1 Tax=Sinorhizobium mexicanum TaxID=375549 RepID=A0A859QVJ3_9HYPH|nr:low molecular weight protein-tyrosine-phosphatase [Sinorhizobium mexicanum]MBP1885628.1 protein-tyrosine phosphatase [Sinorhizobium mexicanum]QLL63559.1 low molecular weight phosphotyrosine protein phosphatase [Sinorhizobium mexicanum]